MLRRLGALSLPLPRIAIRCTNRQRLVSSWHSPLPNDEVDDPPFSPRRETPPPAPKQQNAHRKAPGSASDERRPIHPKTASGLANPKALTDPGKSEERPAPLHSDLPYDFCFSYSEVNPSVKPIGFREPRRFSPFGPGRLDRKWNGVSAPADAREVDQQKVLAEREKVLGEPLTDEEVQELVERYRHSDCKRQINLGNTGVTHNMIDDIHNHWKRALAVRVKCLGVPTLDMENVCFHLEDKSGGKVIYQNINILLLYRGRNYDPKQRPAIPLMLWKPRAPIYPQLVKNVADGLTFEETKEMRNRGLHSPALMKLTRNGVYVNVIERIREAFKTEEVVRLDCSHMDASTCKKIGVKLRDLVPCVPLLFKDCQVILWKGTKPHQYLPSHSQ